MRNLPTLASLFAAAALLFLGSAAGCAGPGEQVGVDEDDQLPVMQGPGAVDAGGMGSGMR